MPDRIADKATRRFYEDGVCPKQWQPFRDAALRKLDLVMNATTLNDCRVPPSNNFEALKGDRAGQYSIRIAGKSTRYRITFSWVDGEARSIRIEDYHGG
jgi:proteic killer suppression protein